MHQIVGDHNANWTFVKIVVDDQDPPLVVSGNTSKDYAENGTAPVDTYSVADAQGTITWSLFGDDTGDFSISSAGVLTFNSPPDHENPADSNRDNVYQVTIHASDGTSTGVLLVVTITVTDEEPPSSPVSPTVSATSGARDSLDVIWNAPDNVGKPDIDSYDLQHRKEGTSGDWSMGPQNQTGTRATITDLDEDASYEVQVRATNEEGDSPWSDAGTGQTYAPPTVSAIEISSDAGTDRTYAVGDEIRVTGGVT